MGTVRVGAPACSIDRAHRLVIIVFDMGFDMGFSIGFDIGFNIGFVSRRLLDHPQAFAVHAITLHSSAILARSLQGTCRRRRLRRTVNILRGG